MRKRKYITMPVGIWIALVWAVIVFIPQAEAAGSMKAEAIGLCSDCHEEILVEIGSGSHLEEPLETGVVYSDCAQCHDPHPEVGGPMVNVHQFSRFDNDELCSTCHFSGNLSGASAMVLPPKSLLCAPCHISDLTMDDPVSIVSLAVFLLGLLGLSSVWFSGIVSHSSKAGNNIFAKIVQTGKSISKAVFSLRLCKGLSALLLDGISQKQLYRQSKVRWAFHSLIFLPMLIRFCWGVFVVIFTGLMLEHPLALVMLDKNHPIFGALMFELTGWVAVAGMILMGAEKMLKTRKNTVSKIEGLPKHGLAMFYLLVGIFVVGFILKGMRIAMTGFPAGSEAAVLSSVIASFFKGMNSLSEFYGYIWYAHAVMVGIFIAALPFSRMFHMIMSPFVIMIKAMQNHEK